MKGEIVVETRGLSMHFGGVVAVDQVDFNLRENELRCLIGPNGAGKSTFFKCLTGQLKPTFGDVVIRVSLWPNSAVALNFSRSVRSAEKSTKA